MDVSLRDMPLTIHFHHMLILVTVETDLFVPQAFSGVSSTVDWQIYTGDSTPFYHDTPVQISCVRKRCVLDCRYPISLQDNNMVQN